ncbi:MAG: nitroreductase family protein [Gammaproteobacteria bacterium]|nr:nitroreductase family protein [Gammaproteobacteria bacterium]
MKDFFETVRHRHSIRQYRSDLPVEEEKLHAILEMACAAPSAGDLQSYRILVVRDTEKRHRLGELADNQQFIAEAPVALLFCSDPQRAMAKYGERGEKLYALQDATIAAAYAQLAVVAAGLGSTWVGYFDGEQIKKDFTLEPGLEPVAILSIGYPAELPAETPRRPMSEVVTQI